MSELKAEKTANSGEIFFDQTVQPASLPLTRD